MHNLKRFTLRAGLLLVVALAGLMFARPAAAAAVTGTACAPNCAITAGSGTFNLPGGGTATVFGYTTGGAVTAPGGPVLLAEAGQPVAITLNNSLAVTTSLNIVGADLVPDLAGVAPGGNKTYTFTPSTPGTYLYEAGLIPGGAKQLAMGLYGVLIVRPSDGGAGAGLSQLTADAASAFTDETVLVFSELDVDLHASPAAFDLREFKAEYFLINGQAYPNLPTIDVAAGNTLALRLVNAGLTNRTAGLLGLDMTVFATDGAALTFPRRAVAEAVHPGESTDALVSVPAEALTDALFPVYESGLAYLRNASAAGLGGAVTAIKATAGGTAAAAGPVVSAVTASPNPTTGAFDVTITVTFTAPVTATQYFVDQVGGPLNGTLSMTGNTGTAVISSAVLGPLALAGETHPIYVRGADANGWGAFNSVILDLYAAGPEISSLNLDRGGLDLSFTRANPTDGSRDLNLYGTAATGHVDLNGGVTVASAQYTLDGTALSAPFALNLPGTSLTGLSAVIPSATLQTLAHGTYTITVNGVDSLGNTGASEIVNLYIDKQGPEAGSVTVAKSPNNGTLPIDTFSFAVRIRAIFTDQPVNNVQSNIAWAELTIDNQGAAIPFIPADAVFTSASEQGYADIPLATVSLLAEGAHTLQIRARDTAGNWGPVTNAELVVDKQGPVISNVTGVNAPAPGAPRRVRITATVADPVVTGLLSGSNLARAEWFRGTDPGAGRGFAITNIQPANSTAATLVFTTTGNLPNGVSILSLRAQDVAGNWGQVVTHLVQYAGSTPIILASDFTTLGDWAGTVGAGQLSLGQLQGLAALAAAPEGQLQVTLNGTSPAYVYDYSTYNTQSYGVSFLFNPAAAPGLTDAIDIFTGRSYSQELFTLRYENGAGGPEISACLTTADSTLVCTGWHHITAGSHRLGLKWNAGASTQFSLLVDGETVETLNGQNTAQQEVYEVRLGAQGSGLTAGLSGTLVYAQFTSTAAPHSVFLPVVVR